MKQYLTGLVLGTALAGILTPMINIPDALAQEQPELLISQSFGSIDVTDLKGFNGVIVALGVTPDGQTLIVGSNNGRITAIDLSNFEEIYSQQGTTNPYSNIAFSPDGELFAIPSEEIVMIYETATGRLIRNLSSHTGNVSSITISPDSRTLVSASGEDLTLKVWDLENNNLIGDIGENVDSISTVVFHPDGRYFATAAGGIGSDRTIKFWDAQDFSLRTTFPAQFGFIYDLAFDGDGRKLVGAVRNYVKVWDLDNGNREILRLKASPLDLNRIAISPDGSLIATANKESKIQVIDVAGQRIVTTLTGHKGWVQAIAFSPDGKTLYSGAEDKIVKAWDLSNLPSNIIFSYPK